MTSDGSEQRPGESGISVLEVLDPAYIDLPQGPDLLDDAGEGPNKVQYS